MAVLSSFSDAYRDGRANPKTPRRARTPVAVKFGRLAARGIPRVQAARTMLLSVAGFGLIDVAAWRWDTFAGLIATGVSLLVVEALSGE